VSSLGVFGKLPARGDFLAHRLPASFTEPWHGWLARGLADARLLLGERLSERWRVAPAWRFLLAPGLAGPTAAVGILVPSVDAVGRAFPLSLVRLDSEPIDPLALFAQPDRFDRLEAAARRALVPSLDLEAWLGGLDGADADPLPLMPARALPLRVAAGPGELAEAVGATLRARGGHGLAIFWGDGSPYVAGGGLVFHGLPEGRDFLRLLCDGEL
jgi:type VI secretion system protein ImpM